MVESVDDRVGFVEADREFHVALLMAAGNEYLGAICTAIAAALTVSLQHTNPTARHNPESLPAHERIVLALRAGDGEAAARASRQQLNDAMSRLRARVGKTEGA
jgi:DNA-binding FadR family transcriptional regulator